MYLSLVNREIKRTETILLAALESLVVNSAVKWKETALAGMGLNWVKLTPDEWLLLLLHADGQRPVKGEESFHISLFMMQSPPLSFKFLLLSVFSPEVHEALKRLVEKGLVKRDYIYEGGKLIDVYSLSPKGVGESARLLERIKNSWVLVGELVAREGSRVLSEIEALKKTYNGRGVKTYLRLILDKLDSPDGPLDAWFKPSELEYLKKLYRAYRRELT